MIDRIVITLLLLVSSTVLMAEIKVSVDRDPIVASESFRLIFESTEKVALEPDFSVLNKELTVLNSSRRSNTQIVNGDVSHSQQWLLTVIANKTGALNIPSVRLGNKSSQPFTINVVGSAPATKNENKDDVFIEAEVSNESPYVQAQVIFKVKLYHNRNTSIVNASLSDPSISGGQVVVSRFGEDRSYQTRIDGKRYAVIERQYIIFPQSSNALRIEPLIFQGQTGGRSGLFDFDPFGPQPRSIVKRSEPIELNVKPIPDSFTGKTWLPANELSIQEQWSVDPGKLQQGEATTRTLTLRVNGLAASHLPPVDSNIPDKFKQYPDQPEFEETNNVQGYIGFRRDKMAVIPTEAGDFVLPAIAIPWWNTVTDKMEVAELPERTIHVESTVASQVIDTPVSIENKDQTAEEANQPLLGNIGADNVSSSNWKWASITLFLLWLVTLFVWWLSRNKNKSGAIQPVSKASSNTYFKQLKQACKNNEPVLVKDALLQWARLQWPDDSITNITSIKQYCDIELQEELDQLNDHLYGNKAGSWDDSAFLSCLEKHSFKEEKKTEVVGKLEPLYKV